MSIHATAIISAEAELDPSVTIGPYCVITGKVRIGPNTVVGSHSFIEGDVTIGAECRISSSVSLGLAPQDISYGGEATSLRIGDRVTIREFASIHRGTVKGRGVTTIEDQCFLMCYVHVGHDCLIKEGTVIANSANLAGHVTIHPRVNIGGMFAAHQHTEVGELAMVAGMSAMRQSVPPYILADGRPARLFRINKVGLDRAGFTSPVIKAIEEAYRLIRCEKLQSALTQIEQSSLPELQKIAAFYRNSKRGVVSFISSGHVNDETSVILD